MQGWSLSVNPLDDSDGDGIWSTTLSLDTNSYYEFKYVNGVTWKLMQKYLEVIVLLIQEIDF